MIKDRLPEYRIYSSGMNVDILDSRIQTIQLHTHSNYSDGGGKLEDILKVAFLEDGYDQFVLTDHNTIKPSYEAKNIVARMKIPEQRAPLGSEISSAEGHILAHGITRDIRPGLSPEETIYQIHDQGGVATIAHPELEKADGMLFKTIDRLLAHPDPAVHPDGIEVLNRSGMAMHDVTKGIRPKLFPDTHAKTRDYVEKKRREGIILAPISAADSHGKRTNETLTLMIGDGIEAIRRGETIAVFDAKMHALYRAFPEAFHLGVASLKVKMRGQTPGIEEIQYEDRPTRYPVNAA